MWNLKGLRIISLILCFHYGTSEECAEEGRCVEIPLDHIQEVSSLSECWEECRNNRECSWFTFWSERSDCYLFRECGQLLVECEGCLSGRVTCVPKEDFQLLVFGGFPNGWDVQLIPSLSENYTCFQESFPDPAFDKPFGSMMENNITICTGGLINCYHETEESGELIWSPSYELKLRDSSLVTTFDNNIWSFFGGHEGRNQINTWSLGMENFSAHEVGFDLEYGLCSARRNQSHAIISRGSKNTFWYHDESTLIEKWEDGPTDLIHTACGLVFDSEEGYQFVTAGGTIPSEDLEVSNTEVYSFEHEIWIEGPHLRRRVGLAASVAYQNTFLLVGGCSEYSDEYFQKSIFQYDAHSGWIELPVELSPNCNIGAMRVPKGKLQCPSSTA